MSDKNFIKEIKENLNTEITKEKAEYIKNYFWQYMHYENFNTYAYLYTIGDNIYKFQVEKQLLFWICSDELEKKCQNMMQQELSSANSCEWGILIHKKGIWLFNRDISISNDDDFRAKKIVFTITFSPKNDDDYLEFFSYDNLFGCKRNAYFFRDIINYKNTNYSGTPKSWHAYSTALKRFFSFYCESIGNYDLKSNPYDAIQIRHFKTYIESRNTITSKTTVRNQFFYIKDFMLKKTTNKDYTISSKTLLNTLISIPDKTAIEISKIDISKIQKTLKIIQKKENYNSTRNITLCLFLFTFGTERRKLCHLKWIDISEDFRMLNTGNVPKAIPENLGNWLKKLKKLVFENETSKNATYVFGNLGTDFKSPLEESRINDILTSIANTDPEDAFSKLLTPQNIRKWVFHHLLETLPLQDVMEYMDISINNLNSYLSQSALSHYVKNDFSKIYPLDHIAKELNI